jgi:hypothetical protein
MYRRVQEIEKPGNIWSRKNDAMLKDLATFCSRDRNPNPDQRRSILSVLDTWRLALTSPYPLRALCGSGLPVFLCPPRSTNGFIVWLHRMKIATETRRATNSSFARVRELLCFNFGAGSLDMLIVTLTLHIVCWMGKQGLFPPCVLSYGRAGNDLNHTFL